VINSASCQLPVIRCDSQGMGGGHLGFDSYRPPYGHPEHDRSIESIEGGSER
jgi:hypothetical protein